jgi:hypothetical protein
MQKVLKKFLNNPIKKLKFKIYNLFDLMFNFFLEKNIKFFSVIIFRRISDYLKYFNLFEFLTE